MKIIIANKYHYLDGGPERYMFGLAECLRAQGHEVIPFGVRYEKNIPSDYDRYFLTPAGGGSETKLDKLEGGIATKLRIAARSVYSFEARLLIEKLITDTRPDVLYCLNIVNHISPSIIDGAHHLDVPVVMRLSDYNLVCPSYLCLRDDEVCTECLSGYYHALRHKCIYSSLSATACRVAGMYLHKALRIYGKVGAFVTPAKSLRESLIKGGFSADAVRHIPTFINASGWTPRYDSDGYVLFLGRLAPEKGVHILIDAYSRMQLNDKLLIVGSGSGEYMSRLEERVPKGTRDRILFLGEKTGEELRNIVRGARYVVVPSVCLDNSPNVVYEAFAAGKPVIGSALGGIQEQITPEVGTLVPPGRPDQLAEAMGVFSADHGLVERLGRNARRLVEKEHSVETHVERLLKLFSEISG